MSDAERPPFAIRRAAFAIGVAALLLVMAAELAFSARQQSQTFDEGAHIFAGYRYWKSFDFGINPEHPPLVKLVAALPLLRMPLRMPEVPTGDFKSVEYSSGREFLYSNDASKILFRARLAAALFTLALALSIFLVANSMFETGPAFLALILIVFEPNFLAHGALVTTDIAASLGLFLGVSTFHLYLKKPTTLRLIAGGLAAGLCLAAKHSGLLLFPMLFAIALLTLPLWRRQDTQAPSGDITAAIVSRAASLLAITTIAFVVLWSTYGFRFAARSSDLSMIPPLSEFSQTMRPTSASAVLTIAHFHLLPQSYLYGVADVFSPKLHPTSLFGKFYPSAQWFYFPAIFLIKSTAGFLLLCCLLPFRSALWRSLKGLLVLIIPPAIYLAAALCSGMNFGIRHLLPFYPFLVILVAAAAWNLAARHRAFAVLVALLFLAHVASSLRAYPNYIPYSNEFWGGPAKSHRILADSNVDWGQGLIALKQYTEQHHIQDCWFAYFGALVSDVSYYGIPCKPLPTAFGSLVGLPTPVVPPQLDGPIFLSASEVSSVYWRTDWANSYRHFQEMQPSTLVANSILVYDGKVDLPEVSALTHETAALQLLRGKFLEPALYEADTAVTVAPNRPFAHATRASVLARMGRSAEAQQEMATAQSLARASESAR